MSLAAAQKTPARGPLAARRDLLFYAVFFVGGMPALMYQVTWQRVLTLYFGVDIYSTSVTVATFLLGLGVGSLLGGWLADRTTRPALHYASIEILMGAFGLASVPLFARVGNWLGGSPLATVIVADFALLLVPTTLMGMTLPLMCRVVIRDAATIGRHLSWLYGVNTLGAATGALVSGYALIGLFGLDGTTRLAAGLNVTAAIMVGLAVARGRAVAQEAAPDVMAASPSFEGRPEARFRAATPGSPTAVGYRTVLTFSFVSGFIALGYEIVWYRLLGILLHGTVYVFGTILFFYLGGIAFGSFLARRRADGGDGLWRFAFCQFGIAAYSFALFSVLGYFSWLPGVRHVTAASFFTSFHPSPELVSGASDVFALYSLLDVAFWALVILGVPTVLMGYGFPNLVRAGSREVDSLGRSIAGVYFANIAGSTLGSLAIGFVVIHYFGSEHALRLLIVAGALVPAALAARLRTASDAASVLHRVAYGSVAVAVVAAALLPGRAQIIEAIHLADFDVVDFVAAEDRSGVSALRLQRAPVAFQQESQILGEQRLYIDGAHHGNASTTTLTKDWAVEAALAAHPAPRRVLAVGLGDGEMVATAALWPEVTELVVVELNGTLERVLRQTPQGAAVFGSAKTRLVVDDGRRWLLANPGETFDLIVMFPLHAAHAYSGALYSREFLELLARHLDEDGIVLTRTVDLYSTARTIATVFPHVLRLENAIYLASVKAFTWRPERLTIPPADLVARIEADGDLIRASTEGARLNTDFTLNSEYYVTYPYASVLQTRVSPPRYRERDARRFWSAIRRGAAE